MQVPILALVISTLFQFSAAIASGTPPSPGKWHMIFNDEFNKFDKRYWNKGIYSAKPYFKDGSFYFDIKNTDYLDGRLRLKVEAKKQEIANSKGIKRSFNMTTGALNSSKKFKFKYGYIEAAIKSASTKGTHSAFWLMPERDGATSNKQIKFARSTFIENGNHFGFDGQGMEIDIAEQLGRWNYKKSSFAAHWDGYDTKLKSFNEKYKIKHIQKDDFIRFGLLWEPNHLTWYANGKKVGELESNRVCDVPMFIVFSTQTGGWAGEKYEYKKLPDFMEVDYIRVWQKI